MGSKRKQKARQGWSSGADEHSGAGGETSRGVFEKAALTSWTLGEDYDFHIEDTGEEFQSGSESRKQRHRALGDCPQHRCSWPQFPRGGGAQAHYSLGRGKQMTGMPSPQLSLCLRHSSPECT